MAITMIFVGQDFNNLIIHTCPYKMQQFDSDEISIWLHHTTRNHIDLSPSLPTSKPFLQNKLLSCKAVLNYYFNINMQIFYAPHCINNGNQNFSKTELLQLIHIHGASFLRVNLENYTVVILQLRKAFLKTHSEYRYSKFMP